MTTNNGNKVILKRYGVQDAEKPFAARLESITVKEGKNPNYPTVVITWTNTATNETYANRAYSFDKSSANPSKSRVMENPGRRVLLDLGKLGFPIDLVDTEDGVDLDGPGLDSVVGVEFEVAWNDLGTKFDQDLGKRVPVFQDVLLPRELIVSHGTRNGGVATRQSVRPGSQTEEQEAPIGSLTDVPVELLMEIARNADGKLISGANVQLRRDAKIQELMEKYPALERAINTSRDLFNQLADPSFGLVAIDDQGRIAATELAGV